MGAQTKHKKHTKPKPEGPWLLEAKLQVQSPKSAKHYVL